MSTSMKGLTAPAPKFNGLRPAKPKEKLAEGEVYVRGLLQPDGSTDVYIADGKEAEQLKQAHEDALTSEPWPIPLLSKIPGIGPKLALPITRPTAAGWEAVRRLEDSLIKAYKASQES